MSRHYLVTWSMGTQSGVPKDRIVNTFSFFGPDAPTLLQHQALAGAVQEFFDTAPSGGGGGTIADYLSPEIIRNAPTVLYEIYRRPVAPGPLGSPVFAGPTSVPDQVVPTAALPGQDALVVSFHGDITSVPEAGGIGSIPTGDAAQDQGAPATHSGILKPRSRRRGRVFVGPLNGRASVPSTNGSALVSPALILVAKAASQALVVRVGADWLWEVWSKRDYAGSPVTGGFVDNRFDTQRHRLEKATSRTIWP